jgi:hypothetical protein
LPGNTLIAFIYLLPNLNFALLIPSGPEK